MRAIAIFLVGTGMYVTGRGTEGYGTILPSILEFAKLNPSVSIALHIVATTKDRAHACRQYLKTLFDVTGTNNNSITISFHSDLSIDELSGVFGEARIKCKAAILAIPDHLHYEYIKLFGRHKIHTLTVKPFVEYVKQAEELSKLFKENEIYGAVEFHKRYDESNLTARKLIQRGDLGEISSVSVNYSQKLKIPTDIFRSWVNQTNVFQYLGVHYVDQIIFTTGAEPTRVMSTGTMSKLRKYGLNVHDEICTVIEWKLGAHKFPSLFRIGWIDPNSGPAMSIQDISYHGTEAKLNLNQTARGVSYIGAGSTEEINPYFSQEYTNGNGKSYFAGYGIKSVVNFITDVIDLTEGRVLLEDLERGRPTFRAAVPSVRVSQAVRESLSSDSSWVSI